MCRRIITYICVNTISSPIEKKIMSLTWWLGGVAPFRWERGWRAEAKASWEERVLDGKKITDNMVLESVTNESSSRHSSTLTDKATVEINPIKLWVPMLVTTFSWISPEITGVVIYIKEKDYFSVAREKGKWMNRITQRINCTLLYGDLAGNDAVRYFFLVLLWWHCQFLLCFLVIIVFVSGLKCWNELSSDGWLDMCDSLGDYDVTADKLISDGWRCMHSRDWAKIKSRLWCS